MALSTHLDRDDEVGRVIGLRAWEGLIVEAD